MSNNYVVYVHINKTNGKRYYGITCQKEKARWAKGKGYSGNKHFTSSINKYGWDGFDHIVMARNLTEDEAKWLEIKMIAAHDTTNPKFGYNLSPGGDMVSKETRKKLSESQKGENNSFYGKHHSEETRKRFSESRKGENNGMYGVHRYGKDNPMYGRTGVNCPVARLVLCVTTNRIFPSTKEGAEFYNTHTSCITNCCRGRRKSAGKLPDGTKLVWRYVNYKHNRTYRVA